MTINKRYSKKVQERILKRLQPPENKTVSQLAKEENIPLNTIYTWVTMTRKQGKMIPELSDKGEYIASESSFYRVLKEAKQNTKRIAVCNPNKKGITTHIATGPNQVWSWNIT